MKNKIVLVPALMAMLMVMALAFAVVNVTPASSPVPDQARCYPAANCFDGISPSSNALIPPQDRAPAEYPVLALAPSNNLAPSEHPVLLAGFISIEGITEPSSY